MRYYLVTGAAGFIGSNFVSRWIKSDPNVTIINVDNLTYAGNKSNLLSVIEDKRHIFVEGDIQDRELMARLLSHYRPLGIIHFAAQTHVDRSITSALPFIESNVIGTYHLLDVALAYLKKLSKENLEEFRFIHISTDEVYGSQDLENTFATEKSPYFPSSPYAASKASSDHFVLSYQKTYNFPAIILHLSNNFGPYQHPEKLIPLTIFRAIDQKKIPLYGDGNYWRDWMFVGDCCEAILTVLKNSQPFETYNIGAGNIICNQVLVEKICTLLDELLPRNNCRSYKELITHVSDRPGHDRRYAMDLSKMKNSLKWSLKTNFDHHLKYTVVWYLNHRDWLNNITGQEYQKWLQKQYGDCL